MKPFPKLPNPHPDHAGRNFVERAAKEAFARVAKLWQPSGEENEPTHSTVSRYSSQLIDHETGKAYSADEILGEMGSSELATAQIFETLKEPANLAGSVVMLHDGCMGSAQTLAVNTERTVEPGPGVAELIRGTTAPLCRYENAEMMLGGAPASALLNPVNLVRYSPSANTPITAAAGLTIIAKVAWHGGYGIEHNLFVGFTDADDIKHAWGAINLATTSSTHPTLQISRMRSASDNTSYPVHFLDIGYGEEVAFAVHYKSLTHIQYFIQARCLENIGCGVDGPNWFPIGENIPTKQLEVANVTAASGATSNGNLTVTVTSANLSGSPKAYTVPLTTAAHTDAYLISKAIADILNSDSAFSTNWTATGHRVAGNAAVVMERNSAADDDSTVNIAITAGIGVSALATSYTQRQGSNPNMTGATVYGYVATQFDSITRVRDVKILSSWNPSNRAKQFAYDRGRFGIHIPSLAKDPISGLTIASWHEGLSHYGTDHVIKAAVKLEDGSWTDPQTIVSALTGGLGIQLSSISEINGILHVVYMKEYVTSSTVEGGPLFWRKISINSTTGVVTAEDEIALEITGTANLGNSPIIQLASGRLLWGFNDETTVRSKVAYSDNDGETWTVTNIDATNWSGEPSLVIESDGAIGCWSRTNNRYVEYSRSTDGGVTWSAAVAITSIPCPGTTGTRVRARNHSNGKRYLAGNDHYTDRRNVTIWEIGDNGAVYGKIPILDICPQTITGGTVFQYPDFIEDGEDIVIAVSQQVGGASSGSVAGTLNCGINVHSLRWPTTPIARESGGTGKRTSRTTSKRRATPPPSVFLAYGTAPVPDMAKGPIHYITLTASTAVIGVPLNPMPWEEMTLVFQQGGTGSYTATFNAIYVFNAITPAWQTAVGSSNIMRAIYNPITNKWVVLSWA